MAYQKVKLFIKYIVPWSKYLQPTSHRVIHMDIINPCNTSFIPSSEILKLVMCGRMGSAIEQTVRWYPGLLESNQNLMFMLKCRQFIEMVNGCDFDVSTQLRI